MKEFRVLSPKFVELTRKLRSVPTDASTIDEECEVINKECERKDAMTQLELEAWHREHLQLIFEGIPVEL